MHGQLLMLGVDGTELSREAAALYRAIQPSGFLLESKNISTPEQTRRLTDSLRDVVEHVCIIAICHEGGEFTAPNLISAPTPTAAEYRAYGKPDAIARGGAFVADMLRMLGCDLNIAPVLEISRDGCCQQCWGDDSQSVIDRAGMWNRWLRKRSMLSCAKFFPGNNPHADIPSLLSADVIPFTALMPELDAIMTGHTLFPKIDPELPASLSLRIVTRFLRDQLGFDHHLVIADDLDHQSMDPYQNAATYVLRAGNDLAVISKYHRAPEVIKQLESLPHHIVDDAMQRIEKFRKKIHKPQPWSLTDWKKTIALLTTLQSDMANRSVENVRINR